ncbi:hypothetical protein [Okeania hirsuta]|uniref:hypothetical protein n=1 Tax=Okeania hirsuta TaxID=1458930 RepID=UPI00195FB9BE|nr:hypothetical protein [Okeania hirsuta]
MVHRNTGGEVQMEAGRDKWWHDEVNSQSADCPAEAMDSEDMLFILYTSGSTGNQRSCTYLWWLYGVCLL